MKKLAEAFFDKARKLINKPTKQEELEGLSSWIFDTAKDIEKCLIETRQNSEKTGQPAGGKNYTLGTDTDIDRFTRKDLTALQPAFEKLHDVCQKANIAVDIAGFDLLPHTSLTSINGCALVSSQGGQKHFLIAIDPGQKYNYPVNPFSSHVPDNRKSAPDNALR